MERTSLTEHESHILPFFWVRGETEAVIRTEIEKIYECGIREICVEARPFEDFAGPAWWSELDIILNECRKRNMRVWILDDKHFPTGYANGLIEKRYPERRKQYLCVNSVDISCSGAAVSVPVREMLSPYTGWWELGKPADSAERENNRLFAIIAVRLYEGKTVYEETVDLTREYSGGSCADIMLPDGIWRIMVFYITRTDGGDPTMINMLDPISAATQIEAVYEPHFQRYGALFGKTLAGFFSDEPQFGNLLEIAYDTKLGKERMPLPWSDALEERLWKVCGSEWKRELPYLFLRTKEEKAAVFMRYRYMDQVSRLYRENFSDRIGAWCEEHGVFYIGHVVEDNHLHSRLGMGAAHYFRAMSGQHMAGMDTIGNQIVFGAQRTIRSGRLLSDGEFYHFALSKMAASCGHLDPRKKGKSLCELYGAYGWAFGVRDMKHVLDHVLAKGINHLVPHAFSMAEYPDPDCPPHFYARGHNPEFPYFAYLMRYAERMCSLLSDGVHVASVLVLYDAEADWTGGDWLPMQKVCRKLIENQIDFDIGSLDMLCDPAAYNGSLSGGKLELNGESFACVVIPYIEHAPRELAEFVRSKGDLPVVFAGGRPEDIIGEDGGEAVFTDCDEVCLEELPEHLREMGCQELRIEPSFPDLSVYHYRKKDSIYVFLNESACEPFEGTAYLPYMRGAACYDAREDRLLACSFTRTDDGRMVLPLDLGPGEMLTVVETEELPEEAFVPLRERIRGGRRIDLSEQWRSARCRAVDVPDFGEFAELEKLRPVSETDPDFSGVIRYKKEFTLDALCPLETFYAEHVGEVLHLWINGRDAGVRLTPPYAVPVEKYLKKGKNTIVAEVATTPARELNAYPAGPVRTEFHTLDPTGMYGKVGLIGKERNE